MTAALGPDDPKTLTVARNLAATQVITVDVVESPRAPPAALSQRLSMTKTAKTGKELEADLAAAAEKRDAVLRARVEKAIESNTLRTPRGTNPLSAAQIAAQIEAQAAAEAALEGNENESSQVPKLKLTVPTTAPAAEEGGAATPRSTYTKASNAAKEAVERSKGGGSARSMLHEHVAKMDWSGS
jgi:hypothetical protein